MPPNNSYVNRSKSPQAMPPMQGSPFAPPLQNSPYAPPLQNSPYAPPLQNSPYAPPPQASPYTNYPYPPPMAGSPYAPPAMPYPSQAAAPDASSGAPPLKKPKVTAHIELTMEQKAGKSLLSSWRDLRRAGIEVGFWEWDHS